MKLWLLFFMVRKLYRAGECRILLSRQPSGDSENSSAPFPERFPAGFSGRVHLRAFINGKMDLTRAEAVQEIVSAKSGKAQSMALNRLSGAVAQRINGIKNKAVHIAASFELQLDYPDDEVEMPEPPSANWKA